MAKSEESRYLAEQPAGVLGVLRVHGVRQQRVQAAARRPPARLLVLGLRLETNTVTQHDRVLGASRHTQLLVAALSREDFIYVSRHADVKAPRHL